MPFHIRLRLLLAMFWDNKDLRIFIINILIGALLQILARRCLKYLEDHPKLLEETNTKRKKTKLKNKNPLVVPRGGAFVVPPAAFAFIKFLNDSGILKFLADSGFLAGIVGSSAGYVIKQIPLDAVSTYVRNSARGALPATHGYVDKSVTTLDDVGKLTLYQCEGINELGYLFDLLKDPLIPFEEKERFTRLIFGRYLNLSTEEGRRGFVLCLLAILCALAIYSPSSYHLLLKMLLKAIREGKISKELIRWIIRRLKRNGLLVNPELLDIAYSSNLVELP
jgi:hypothetical protein